MDLHKQTTHSLRYFHLVLILIDLHKQTTHSLGYFHLVLILIDLHKQTTHSLGYFHLVLILIDLHKQTTHSLRYFHLVLILNSYFLVAVVNTLSTKTHSFKEIAEFSFENADVKSICYCKQRMKRKLSLSSECVKTKLCKPCTSFT